MGIGIGIEMEMGIKNSVSGGAGGAWLGCVVQGRPDGVGSDVFEGGFVDLDLLLQEEGAGLVVVADLVELDLVGDGGGEPGASDDAKFSAGEGEFGDVLGETNGVVDVRLSHANLHGCSNQC